MKTQIETKVIDGVELRRKAFFLRSKIVSVIYTFPGTTEPQKSARRQNVPCACGECRK
jgi:hypothetical protein